MHVYGDEVLEQHAPTELEKVNVYNCFISHLAGMGGMVKALSMSLEVLAKLANPKFPKNSMIEVRKALLSILTSLIYQS